MEKRFIRSLIVLVLVAGSSVIARADIKLKVKNGMAGRTTESTTYINLKTAFSR